MGSVSRLPQSAVISTCPCCGAQALQPLLQTPEMPVNSCLLRWSQEESEQFARAALTLVICAQCGFFWNDSFDGDQLIYDMDYESTQMYSDVFKDYLHQTASAWLQTLDAAPRSILEVGCGQGEFLQVLAGLCDARLLGYDPAYRATPDVSVDVIPEYLPAAPTGAFDLVVCRMTLEHIAQPQIFVSNLARWVAPGGTLIVQVPNAERVITQQNVTEIFYEHVNYFSTGALLRLLERAGFNSNRAEISYGGQNLTVFSTFARGDGATDQVPAQRVETTLPAALVLFTSYWSGILEDRAAGGRDVWIWGTGSRATSFLALLPNHAALEGAVDINPMRDGSYILGTACKTYLPTALNGRQNLTIIVMNPIYRDEISKALGDLSAEAELLMVDDFKG